MPATAIRRGSAGTDLSRPRDHRITILDLFALEERSALNRFWPFSNSFNIGRMGQPQCPLTRALRERARAQTACAVGGRRHAAVFSRRLAFIPSSFSQWISSWSVHTLPDTIAPSRALAVPGLAWWLKP